MSVPWIAQIGKGLVWFGQMVGQLAVYGFGLFTGMKIGEKLLGSFDNLRTRLAVRRAAVQVT